jgi:inosine/xanthosine triphosphate pyrophosphatase family protein
MRINTSNKDKLAEFVRYGLDGLSCTKVDIVEPDADKETIITYKASFCGEDCIVEDTSLDIEGEDVGANVKWLKNNLAPYIGKKAVFHVYIGIMRLGKVEIYHGVCEGYIGESMGSGMGFDPFFYPSGLDISFSTNKPEHLNPRAIAVKKLIAGNCEKIVDPIFSWDGPWQSE